MHDVQHERPSMWLDGGEVLALAKGHFSYSGFLGLFERFAQDDVSMVGILSGNQIIRSLKKHRIDLFDVDKVSDRNALRCLSGRLLKVFFGQYYVFALLVFVTFHQIVVRDLVTIDLTDADVVNPAQVLFMTQVKFKTLT